VLACATVAGVGPFGAEGLDFLEGMGRGNHAEFGAALAGPAELQAYLEREAQRFAGVTDEQVAAALGDLVSLVDVAALTGDFAAYVALSFRRALANGIWGWFDDDLTFTRPRMGGELPQVRVLPADGRGEREGPWRASGSRTRAGSGPFVTGARRSSCPGGRRWSSRPRRGQAGGRFI
jgi:hypothetical protein